MSFESLDNRSRSIIANEFQVEIQQCDRDLGYAENQYQIELIEKKKEFFCDLWQKIIAIPFAQKEEPSIEELVNPFLLWASMRRNNRFYTDKFIKLESELSVMKRTLENNASSIANLYSLKKEKESLLEYAEEIGALQGRIDQLKAVLAPMVERLFCNQDAVSSNLTDSTK